MPHPEASLAQEWITLQNNHEQYEKSSLLIKLAGVAAFLSCLALGVDALTTALLILVLWVQEGITRTSQSRLGDRLLRIEQLLRQEAPQAAHACQLHTEWLASRPGFSGLLAEYARNMRRPTVAFPYVVLVLMNLGWGLFYG